MPNGAATGAKRFPFQNGGTHQPANSWPQRNLAGNAIDFHVQVLGLSFHDAMRHITGTVAP